MWRLPFIRCPILFWDRSSGVFLFATFLLLGFLTRLCTFFCWMEIVVLQHANPFVLQGGDILLKLLLFWALFLPLGAVWSINARRRIGAIPFHPLVETLISWIFILQLCLVYWCAALLKSDAVWIQTGDALFYALNIEHFTTPFGLYLRQDPDLLRILTFGARTFEFVGPLLLFVPVYRNRFWLLAVTLFIGFHLIGMQSLLQIGLFPWVCAIAWLVFVPGFFWDALDKRTGRLRARPDNSETPGIEGSAALKNSSLLEWGMSAFMLISFLDVLAWNAASLSGNGEARLLNRYDEWSRVFQLNQRWNMYAPYPRKDHGWLVIPADLADGQQVDLFTGNHVSWEKPRDIGAYFGDDRWRRYLSNLFDNRDPQTLEKYTGYLVGTWNAHHGDAQKIQVVSIIFMRETTLPTLTISPPEREVLYFHAY